MSGQCIPLRATVCVFSFYTACVRYRTIAAMVTGTTHWLHFSEHCLPMYWGSKWTVTVMVPVQDSEWHVVIMLLCKEYFKYGYCLKENVLVV